MPILTFSPNAVLGGFSSWLQYQGLQAACQPQEQFDLRALAQWLTPGVKAQAGDSVRYSAFLTTGSAALDYGGQWMNEKGVYSRYNRTLNVTSASSPVRSIQPANAGWYRDAAISLQTAGITGQTLYVTQELGRTNGGVFVPYAMLAQGWLTSTAPVSGTTQPPPDGGGTPTGGGCCVTEQVLVFGTGVASIAKDVAVAAGTNVRLLTVACTLLTGAAIGLRTVYLFTTNGIGAGYYVYAPNTQPAATSRSYFFQAGGETRTVGLAASELLPIPPDYWFDRDFTVFLQQDGVLAGDDWTACTITYEIRG